MKKRRRKAQILSRLLFVCYDTVMLYLLFVRGRVPQDGLPYWEQVAENYNFSPLHTISNYWDILSRPEYYIEKWEAAAIYKTQVEIAVINLAGNVLMFVPFGFLLPLIWKSLRKFWKTLIFSAAVIIFVELLQLLSLRGSCDIDDLILNLFGVWLGYGLWRFLYFLRKRKK